MIRYEMLNKLHTVKFKLFWPGDWKDIGFTEREIWVNSNGYGYVSCDEIIGEWEGIVDFQEKWTDIKNKIKNNELVIDDLKDTNLNSILEEMHFEDEEDDLSTFLEGILDLPDSIYRIYCTRHDWGLVFYDNEVDFKKAYERDEYDYSWEELDDGLLAEWIKRLTEEDCF